MNPIAHFFRRLSDATTVGSAALASNSVTADAPTALDVSELALVAGGFGDPLPNVGGLAVAPAPVATE